MQKNLFAYTAPGSNLPDFISINERDGKVYVTVRGAVPTINGVAVETAVATVEVELPRDRLLPLAKAAVLAL